MNSMKKLRNCIIIVIRWAARVLGTFLLASTLLIFVGESLAGDGPGNPFKHPPEVQLGFAGMLAMLAGMVVGWQYEGVGGLLVLCGLAVFHSIERKIWLNWTFGLFGLVGILYLLCWGLRGERGEKSA